MSKKVVDYLKGGCFFLSEVDVERLQNLGMGVSPLEFVCGGNALLYMVNLPVGYLKVVGPVNEGKPVKATIMSPKGNPVVSCCCDEENNIANSK